MNTRNTETVDPCEPAQPTPIRIFAPGTSLGDRYEVREVLGMGGSGVVYAAYDRELRRSVALKVLRSDRSSESALKRFRREVAIARDAHSPHLVRVFDIDAKNDSIFLTMELIDGESLRARLASGPMALGEVVALASQIVTALDALHRLGIVHRDVKPGNILITRDGLVKLADFGLARHVERSETHATETEGVVGTFEYLSPEQALGEELDARSDLYAFGIVLFEMLAGDVPYRSDSSIGTVLAHLKGAIPDVRKRRREVPRWLAAVTRRLLERDRALRYPTADEVRRDIQERRHPRPRFRTRPLATAAALTLAIGAGAWGVQQYRGTHFDRLVTHGNEGARALDRRGRVLWTHPSLLPGVRAATAVIEPGGQPVIAAIVGDPIRLEDLSVLHRLSFLDARTGREVSHVQLPSSGHFFPDFSNTYGPTSLRAVDINHDGVHEIVVSYCHHPYYPTYTVFYDPSRKIAGTVFAGSGHHTLAGTLDIDGDGTDELILQGPSNRLGWYLGIAAVRVSLASSAPARYALAATPDRTFSASTKRALLWYALVGASGYSAGSSVDVDSSARTVSVTFEDGSRVILGRHGFESHVQPAEAKRRNAAREQAYEALYDATRLAGSRFSEHSLERVQAAVAHADRTGNEPLAAWSRRVAVSLLIRAGRPGEAEAKLREIAERFDAASSACYDGAMAFHQRGDLERAYRWYREGLRRIRLPTRGRFPQEFLEGMLFIHAERGDWDAAQAELDAYERSNFEMIVATDKYADWIEWRGTGRARRRFANDQSMIDLHRYVALEADAQLAPGEDVRTVAKIDASHFSGVYNALAQSLKAEILARRGDRAQAAALVREALSAVRSSLQSDPAARAHLAVVESRFRAITGTGR